MTTTHEYMAECTLERLLSDADGREALALARSGLREGKWHDAYVDAVGQHGLLPRTSWPMEQVAAFAEVHTLVFGGAVAHIPVATLRPPLRDADREGNAEILATLPRPFRAEVDMHQANAGGDGTVSWDEPIWVSLATGLIDRHPDGTTTPFPLHIKVPPGSAVLEIGSSLPSRTWEHLIWGGGSVARWPYGHSLFVLFLNLDRTTMLGHLFAEHLTTLEAGAADG